MPFVDDIVLVDEINAKLEIWQDAIESKKFSIKYD